MKKFFSLCVLTIIVVGSIVVGCTPPAEKTFQINKNLKVELLTTFEGMKIYRVMDGGNRFYIADQRAVVSYKSPVDNHSGPRMIVNDNSVSFSQEGNQIVMRVKFDVQPVVEKDE